MAWKLLPTDYTDAVWSGLKRYTQVDNSDGTVTMYPNSSERKSRSCWRNNHAVAHFAMAQQEGGEKHGCYLCGTHCQG